ncbi:MAG: asparagine synthase (glutamine-hydrolyzing) [Deltaproteobacteria bacterium]|nr:asparagine synthase (glutamine-hydrolyzing) [Deltaproteobacteria bacterium]
MCGICGLTRPDGPKAIEAMAAAIRHRGPDDHGIYISPESEAGSGKAASPAVGLGHRRLSIIDLSPAGRQPMTNEDGTIILTYNGEIYNYPAWRRRLIQSGHQFRSQSDTEVIIHLYEELGQDCLKELNGIFAFALLDLKQQRLILARDHLGLKPLYYADIAGRFYFASEIKSILAGLPATPEINWPAIYHYFSFLYVPHPATAFSNIHQLPPGCALVYDLTRDRYTVAPYWQPEVNLPPSPNGPSYEDNRAAVRSLLTDAVSWQLLSDVPVGLFLSGGIDSTVLAGLIARASAQPVNTFTVVFQGEGISAVDDAGYARQVARALGTRHRELIVDISQPEEMFDLIRCFDQPFANPTFYLAHLIAQEARKQVKVAISGAGGDELFAGYPRYRALALAPMWQRLPACSAAWVKGILELFREDPNRPLLRRLKLLARGMGRDLDEQLLVWTYYFDDREKSRLFAPGPLSAPMVPSSQIISRYLKAIEGPLPRRMAYLDLKTFLVDNILEYTDKTSMDVGLEVRAPFLDYRLVELSLNLPFDQKRRHGQAKYILKDAFADLLPQKIVQAPKRGFCPPLSVWMTTRLDKYFDEHMTPAYLRGQGLFDPQTIARLRWEHRTHRRDNSMELFSLIMFDVWFKRFFS